jgi:hypothetical protein
MADGHRTVRRLVRPARGRRRRRLSLGRRGGLAETHPGVAECYVRQDRDGLVRIYVVPDDHDPAAAGAVLASVKDVLFELAGRSFPLDVAAAERVPITAGGKGRFVTSDYQRATPRSEVPPRKPSSGGRSR